jgi:hypothetical protein
LRFGRENGILVTATASSCTSRCLPAMTSEKSHIGSFAVLQIVAEVKVFSSTVVVDAGNVSASWPDAACLRVEISLCVYGVEPMVDGNEFNSGVRHNPLSCRL